MNKRYLFGFLQRHARFPILVQESHVVRSTTARTIVILAHHESAWRQRVDLKLAIKGALLEFKPVHPPCHHTQPESLRPTAVHDSRRETCGRFVRSDK